MKKFTAYKDLDTIEAQCKAAGIQYDARMMDEHGSDYIVVRTLADDSHSGEVLYNMFNGNFFGTTPDGIQFDSMNDMHEDEPWFQQLLSFFYVEKEPE